MRDFPSCFGESGTQIADSSAGHSANASAVTCVYRTQLDHGDGRIRECRMTVIWSKTLLGQLSLSIALTPDLLNRGATGNHNHNHTDTDTDTDIDIDSTIRSKKQLSLLDIKLGPPWLGVFSNSQSNSSFSSKLKWKHKGSRSLFLSSKGTSAHQLHVFWDLSAAKFSPGPGPQPSEGFYVAVVSDLKMVLLLGDLTEEAYRISGASSLSPQSPGPGAICVAKKQHISGNKLYTAQACFCDGGRCHDIAIECDASPSGSKEPCLEIRVDRRRVMQVKRLPWKFRGNQTIVVDGAPVEVLWDVHSWLFGAGGGGLSAAPNAAVFMFHTAPGTANMPQTHLGFSLLLYAWKVQ